MSEEALTAGTVARRLGVAVTTLRTWHQRYGLGPSQHNPGQHRRYTAEDLDRLEVMRRLTAQGVAPAEAAAWARRMPVSGGAGSAISGASGLSSAGAPGSARNGGGHTIPVGRAGAAARGLARAATRMDGPALRDILELTIAGNGVVGTWDEVMMPVLIGVGQRYEETQGGYIEVEHLISRAATEAFSTVPRPPSHETPRVLLAAADEEQHTLPLEALSAALAEHGIPSRMLGARVPPRALADSIERTGPVAVVLWSQLPETGDPGQFTAILSGTHPPLLVAAAGPGWRDLPPGVTPLHSLASAVEVLSDAVRPR